METYNRARSALQTFYSAAQGKLPVHSFSELITNYRTHVYGDGSGSVLTDDFLEELDGALKYSKQTDTDAAMRKLADVTPKGKMPSHEAFFKALANQAESLTAKEFTGAVSAGLKQTAKVVTGAAIGGVGLYVAIGVGLLLAPQVIPYIAKKIGEKMK